ncbi:MAG: hypothetical protein ABSC41_16860 [Acidimicrobiales bacterium]
MVDGSLVCGSVVIGSVIGEAVPASALSPTSICCEPGDAARTAVNTDSPGPTLLVHETRTVTFAIGENLSLQGSGTLRRSTSART